MIVARSRLRLPVALAVLAVAVAGCGGSSKHASLRPTVAEGCSTAVASASVLRGVQTTMLPVAGAPFGVATTSDGRWSFVDELGAGGSRVAVFSDARGVPRLVRSIPLPTSAVGNALTDDGRYLLAADGGSGAAVVSVVRAEGGAANPVLGRLERTAPRKGARLGALGGGAIEAAGSRDGRYVFVSVEYGDAVAVYDLQTALTDHFSRGSYLGSVPLGRAVVGMAVSPDGRWLYVTSEIAAGARTLSSAGTLSVISIAKAEQDPARSVVATAQAGCQPVRVVVSADGRTVWVTARASDALLAFSAAKLIRSPARALLAAVRVGEAPVGLALVRHGSLVVVADSNRFSAHGAHAALTVVDAAAALAQRPAIVGTIPAGLFPREMSLVPPGRTLLVGNFASDQLEAVNLSAVP
jgi:DNA-binding beta-propeller fold protein YncE